MVSTESAQRPAQAGELCTCGRLAIAVFEGGRFGDTGYCGRPDGGEHPDGTCVFCGDEVDHDHYWAAQARAGRDAVGLGDGQAQSGRCPLYRLRLADPLPVLAPGSVRRYDPAADRLERAPGRLREELNGIVVDALHAAGRELAAGQFDRLDLSHEIGAEQILEELAAHGDRAAVVLAVNVATESIDEVELDKLAGQVWQVAESDFVAGVADHWSQTDPVDRPLLVLRHLVRRRINPEAPAAIHRTWIS